MRRISELQDLMYTSFNQYNFCSLIRYRGNDKIFEKSNAVWWQHSSSFSSFTTLVHYHETLAPLTPFKAKLLYQETATDAVLGVFRYYQNNFSSEHIQRRASGNHANIKKGTPPIAILPLGSPKFW